MTRADRVHSTPPTNTPIDPEYVDYVGDAIMSLRDCRKMGDIAAGLMSSHKFADPFTPENESLLFAVLHLANMLTKLEKEYDARWHGEVRG
jgi:hypothetical protein